MGIDYNKKLLEIHGVGESLGNKIAGVLGKEIEHQVVSSYQ